MSDVQRLLDVNKEAQHIIMNQHIVYQKYSFTFIFCFNRYYNLAANFVQQTQSCKIIEQQLDSLRTKFYEQKLNCTKVSHFSLIN